MKQRAVIYCRVATAAERVDSQLCLLRELAAARGFSIVQEYIDRGSSGVKARRPGLDFLMADARQGKFDVVLVCAFQCVARSTKHFLQVVGALDELDIGFISAKEAIDTTSHAGRQFMSLSNSLLALEKSLSGEKIRQGMRRAEFEGQRLGRAPLDIDRSALVRDRFSGMSLTNVARKYGVSRASVVRFVREAQRRQIEDVGGFTVTEQHEAAAECVA